MQSVRLIFLAVVIMTAVRHEVATQLATQPQATEDDCVCSINDKVCRCTLRIEHRLTMILEAEKQIVYPSNGVLKQRNDESVRERTLSAEEMERVITADGNRSRLVIAVNGRFPGPRIEVFKDQTLEVKVINELHTDSVTIHFHGLHQIGTPWMDGVAAVTQCPILPGQTFVYRFKVTPEGTALYHAHIGDQRSMGLYGPLIVRDGPSVGAELTDDDIIVALQDWNNLMDAETAYQRMITQQFDFNTFPPLDIPTTTSVDGGMFSRFEFHSGLINGKARFWRSSTEHNEAPLERFKVRTGRPYKFRVIGAMTLYPMEVYIPGTNMTIYASDGFRVRVNSELTVNSFIIQPGERVDFIWTALSSSRTQQYMLVAETIETPESIGLNKYHAAEAIIEVVDSGRAVDLNPLKGIKDSFTSASPCLTFNCPYGNVSQPSRRCLNFGNVYNNDIDKNLEAVLGDSVSQELFFNFAFPGARNTPGSVNGREFLSPPSPLLTQLDQLTTACDDAECERDGTCKCTYFVNIPYNKKIQMVFMNLGNGSGWSHPIHLHGHSFYVMKTGFGVYDRRVQRVIQTRDITCTDRFNFCSSAEWANSSWAMGNLPDMNDIPPQKDTIVVPTGGYVVIRFISNNPGMWFLHCHIDLHNTNGMGMVINEASDFQPTAPIGFPQCGDFLYDGTRKATSGREGLELATRAREGLELTTRGREGLKPATSGREGLKRLTVTMVITSFCYHLLTSLM